MNRPPGRFEMRRAGTVLGTFTIAPEGDFPWMVGYIEPTPAFDDVVPLFSRENELFHRSIMVRGTDEEPDVESEWSRALDAVLDPGVTMTSLDFGWVETVGILNVDGLRVAWRGWVEGEADDDPNEE